LIINVITLFPELYQSNLDNGNIKKAIKLNKLKVNLINLKDYGIGSYKQVDDKPYGSNTGMLLRVDVLHSAIKSVGSNKKKVILLSPQGTILDQAQVTKLAKEEELLLISGSYEGYDERIYKYVDLELSIGSYILSHGDLPALVVLDSISRSLEGVIKEDSLNNDSLSNNLLKYPEYTHPVIYDGQEVPSILLSGNHQAIEEYNKEQAIKNTKKKRPDLLK
jgi:tRNA (guanine37-N1)-methyltransferase